MEVVINLRKGIEQNASAYFEEAKKAKRKLEGAREALEDTKSKMELNKLKAEEEKKRIEAKAKIKHEWYEKFRWFISSKGKLVLLGRDATTNEIIIKKHTEPNDAVFHTESAKSPYCVVPGELDDATRIEAATATASFSSAWAQGQSNCEVFQVKPEQVSKKAQAGEYLTKGAFMIYGKKELIPVKLGLAVGVLKDGRAMCAPLWAVKANCEAAVEIIPGKEKNSSIAKFMKKRLNGGDLDDFIKVLPSGGCAIK